MSVNDAITTLPSGHVSACEIFGRNASANERE